MDNSTLFNPGFEEDDNLGNIRSSKVADMQQGTLPDTPDNAMLMQVTVDFKVSRAVVFDSGRHARLGSKNTFMPKIGRRGCL